MSSPSPAASTSGLIDSANGRKWSLAFVLVISVVLLYWSAVRFSFLNYDDDKYVTANPHVQAGLTVESLRWSLDAHVVGHWQPVTLVSHMLDCQLYGVSPAGHHLTSVFLHALNVVLLFFVLASLTRSLGLSFFVTALFAAHPLNIENVAWIAERKTLVSAFFSLLAIAAYQWYASRPCWRRWLLVASCFTLALASKATAITLPAIFLLFDYWPLNRIATLRNAEEPSSYPAVSLNRAISEKLPMLALCLVSAWITIAGQAESKAIATIPLAERLGHAAWSYVFYVVKLAWPSRVAILYPYEADPWWKPVLGALLVIGLSAAVFGLRRRRYLVVGWLFYLLGMLPVIGLIQVGHQSFADHFLYVPEVGIFILVAWGGKDLADRMQIRPKIQRLLAAAVIVAFAATTAANLPYWKNSYTVFAHAEAVNHAPDFVIENNLAQGLVELGRPLDAIAHYQKAVSLAPNDPLPRYNLAARLAEAGKLPGAVEQYNVALSHSPDRVLSQHILHNLGTIYAESGDLVQAEQKYSAAIELDSRSAMSFFGRGQVLYRQGRFHEAGADFARAAALQPLPVAYYWLGKAASGDGKRDDAAQAYSEALRLDPNYTAAREELARLK